MLDLMSFKEEFVSQCRRTLCEAGPEDMKIEEQKVNKAQRGELNGVLFMKEGLLCAPTFYVEDFYKAYRDGTSISDLSNGAIETAVRSMDLASMLARDSSGLIEDTDRLRVRMLNKNRNKDYLKDRICLELDCGFVYVAEIGLGGYGAVITKEMMKEYKMSRKKLFDIAIRNTTEEFPAVLYDLGESAMGMSGEFMNLLDSPSGKLPAGAGPGFVLSNSKYFWGAGTIFYPGMLERLSELLDGDFYILPSSIHELILIAADDQDPQQLADLVRSANRSVVKDNEVLADDLYICESGQLRRVSFGGVIPECGDMLC